MLNSSLVWRHFFVVFQVSPRLGTLRNCVLLNLYRHLDRLPDAVIYFVTFSGSAFVLVQKCAIAYSENRLPLTFVAPLTWVKLRCR